MALAAFLRRQRTRLAAFGADIGGGIAIITAFATLPVVLAVGLSVDFVTATDARAKLDAAADTSALAGAIAAKAYILANQNNGQPISVLNSDAIAVGKSEAQNVFEASVLPIQHVANTSSTTTLTIEDQTITSKVAYSAQVPLAFGPIVSKNEAMLANTVTAQTNLPLFLDIYVALDISSSMGIGATQADIDLMNQRIGCSFGCHVQGDGHYDAAHAAGATMRIDVLRDAITTMVNQADGIKVSPDQFRFSLHVFSSRLATLQQPTTDYGALRTAINGVAPDTVDGGTNFHVALGDQLPPLLPTSGSGLAGAPRKSHVILITDGVEDCVKESPWLHCDESYVNWYGNGPQGPEWSMQAFDPAICTAIKNTGATVSVLNVKYVAPPGLDVRYDYVRNNILANIPTTIGGCASNPSTFYTANSPAEIRSAINAIFGQISKAARLTN